MKLYCCSYIDDKNNSVSHFLRNYRELTQVTLEATLKGFNPSKTLIEITGDSKRTVTPIS